MGWLAGVWAGGGKLNNKKKILTWVGIFGKKLMV
jgi:hypothetical protein